MSDRRRWLIVGLGNPGPKYQLTRHNVGFMALDLMVQSLGLSSSTGSGSGSGWSTEQKALVLKSKGAQNELIFVKPQTFMNLSGESVQPLMAYYKVELENLVVVHDEIDIPFAKIRFQKNRGAGGHNGLKSINERMGTQDYIRLKLGVGRPAHPDFAVADYVLQSFAKEEQDTLGSFLEKAGDAIECLVTEGLDKASTKFNG